MVSKVYTAKDFFKLQTEGKIAKGMETSKKLRLDNKGFYLNKKSSNGEGYFQRIKDNSKVYSRQEGVTMYSKALDKKRKSTHKKEGYTKHNKRPQFEDRESLTSSKKYDI